jgi:hypothetical protein
MTSPRVQSMYTQGSKKQPNFKQTGYGIQSEGGSLHNSDLMIDVS